MTFIEHKYILFNGAELYRLNTYRKEEIFMKTTAAERAPAFTGKDAKSLLCLMAQEMTDNEALFLLTLASKIFFNGNWNAKKAALHAANMKNGGDHSTDEI